MIATFYSFRPELGCTMAAVNTGIVLAQESSRRVLLVEWKSTATTLLTWLQKLSHSPSGSLLDLLWSYKDLIDGDIPIEPDRLPRSEQFINQTQIPQLHYLPSSPESGAGKSDLKSFDWNEFYTSYHGGAIVERIRKEWENNYDVTIVVSEKETRDPAGICTIQLPDVILVMMSTNMDQINKSREIAEQFTDPTTKKDGRQVHVLPVPRVDLAEEGLRREFIERLRQNFSEHLPGWIDASTYFEDVQVPEIGYYRYTHEIAVLREPNEAPQTISSAYRKLAGYLLGFSGGS